jgi:hypothetical protein
MLVVVPNMLCELRFIHVRSGLIHYSHHMQSLTMLRTLKVRVSLPGTLKWTSLFTTWFGAHIPLQHNAAKGILK